MAILISRTSYIDVNGQLRTTQIVGASTLAVVRGQVLLLTNSDEATDSEAPITVNPTPNPVAATYQSVTDIARLLFLTSAGTIVTINVPAPLASMFMADGETVDPTSVAGLLTAATGVVSDLSGNTVASYVGGTRGKD